MEVDAGAALSEGISVAVGKLKRGVVNGSVAAEEEIEEGVEACSVANRSGVGVEAGLKSPHPSIKTIAAIIHKNLSLFMV